MREGGREGEMQSRGTFCSPCIVEPKAFLAPAIHFFRLLSLNDDARLDSLPFVTKKTNEYLTLRKLHLNSYFILLSKKIYKNNP